MGDPSCWDNSSLAYDTEYVAHRSCVASPLGRFLPGSPENNSLILLREDPADLPARQQNHLQGRS